jgi:uncharacterized protein (TIGR00251 family)
MMTMTHPLLTETGDGDLVFWVFVQPGAARAKVVGPYLDSLKLRVSAPPERGKANDEVCALLATTLHVRRADVRVDLGHASRRKRVRIVGGATAATVELLDALLR